MLGNWRSHSDYQAFLISRLMEIYETNTTIVEYYLSSIDKLYNLNLNVIKHLLLVKALVNITDCYIHSNSTFPINICCLSVKYIIT